MSFERSIAGKMTEKYAEIRLGASLLFPFIKY